MTKMSLTPWRSVRRLLVTLLAGALALCLGSIVSVASASATQNPETGALMVNGSQLGGVHAHGGGILRHGDYFYFYGDNRGSDGLFAEVSVYRSQNMVDWEYRGAALSRSTDARLDPAWVERPKVIYNDATGKFVMWAHWENGVDYREAKAIVATADSPEGPFTVHSVERPLGDMSRDSSLYKDDDGKAYFITASNENADLHIYPLSDDYLTPTVEPTVLWPGLYREAPAMFKRNGMYFLVTSGQSGWSPNQQKYASAPTITGPWSELRNLGDSQGYGAQTTYVQPIEGALGTSYLWMGDDWAPAAGGAVNESTYRWLPLEFSDDTTMTMTNWNTISIDVANGSVVGVEPVPSPPPPTYLENVGSGKCVTVADDRVTDGAKIDQWTCVNQRNQQFTPLPVDEGYVQLAAVHSEKCLDVPNAASADGIALVQWSCNSGKNQQWKVESVGDMDAVQIVSRSSGKCMAVRGGSVTNGALIEQQTCNQSAQQLFLVADGPSVEVSATSRCVAGKAYLLVVANNTEAVSADITITTSYGAKAFNSVEPGKNAFHAFTTRVANLAAGEVVVRATAQIDGLPAASTTTVGYQARSCG